MKKIKIKQMVGLIKEHYRTKTPLFISGTYGIGKSSVVKQSAVLLAKAKNKEYIDWNKTTKEKKLEMLINPEKYFVVMDERLSQYEPSDLKGLPQFDSEGYLEWKLPLWLVYLSQKDADGILFFDEINLAVPSVLASCYQIFHDREINEQKLSDNILIVSAGNRAKDKANVYDIPNPLRDRKSEFELVLNAEDWFDWAIQNNIERDIIGFIKFREDYLFKENDNKESKPVSPRGWERTSKLIKGVKDEEMKELLVAGAIGEGVAMEFMAFCKLQHKLDLNDLLKHPEKIKQIDGVDLKYSLIAGLSAKFEGDKKVLEPILNICNELEAEYGVLLMRFLVGIDKKHLKRNLPKSKLWVNTLSKEFGNYLI